MSEILWDGKEVIGVIDGHGSYDWTATGVSIDTRTINKGDIFFALPGINNDGNEFIEDALNKGACSVISNRPSLINSKKVVFVNDVYKALNKLAKYARQRTQDKIIGIIAADIVVVGSVVFFTCINWRALLIERKLGFVRPRFWRI